MHQSRMQRRRNSSGVRVQNLPSWLRLHPKRRHTVVRTQHIFQGIHLRKLRSKLSFCSRVCFDIRLHMRSRLRQTTGFVLALPSMQSRHSMARRRGLCSLPSRRILFGKDAPRNLPIRYVLPLWFFTVHGMQTVLHMHTPQVHERNQLHLRRRVHRITRRRVQPMRTGYFKDQRQSMRPLCPRHGMPRRCVRRGLSFIHLLTRQSVKVLAVHPVPRAHTRKMQLHARLHMRQDVGSAGNSHNPTRI